MTDLVIRKLSETFSDADREVAAAELDATGINEERVHLAIIKLSERKLGELRKFIEVAKVDQRDVLAWAEYPEEFAAATWNMKEEEVAEIRVKDREQYLSWLRGK